MTPPKTHGNHAAYSHGCRCDECRAGHAAYKREATAKRRLRVEAAAPDTSPHGRYTTYTNWGCRCAECRAAWAAYHRDRRSKEKTTT